MFLAALLVLDVQISYGDRHLPELEKRVRLSLSRETQQCPWMVSHVRLLLQETMLGHSCRVGTDEIR